jgi:diketogulonate reductase-like aldo/keto reductase
MIARRIGDRELHPIGIGTWGMGGDRLSDGGMFADYREDDRQVRAIRYSISRGQNHIDTAQIYGAGHTEEIVGEAINGFNREQLFIATKVWRSHSLRHAVPRAAENSLRKLNVDILDLLYVHAPWDGIPMAEYIGGINDAQDAGLTKAIGVSNFNVEQLAFAVSASKHPIVANQIHYNFLKRDCADAAMIKFCADHDITIVAYRPVERRLLADKVVVSALIDAAERIGCSTAQLAIAWLIAQENVVTIPKASTPEHIDENIAAANLRIPDDVLVSLNRDLS